jgi:hypothetical protein
MPKAWPLPEVAPDMFVVPKEVGPDIVAYKSTEGIGVLGPINVFPTFGVMNADTETDDLKVSAVRSRLPLPLATTSEPTWVMVMIAPAEDDSLQPSNRTTHANHVDFLIRLSRFTKVFARRGLRNGIGSFRACK